MAIIRQLHMSVFAANSSAAITSNSGFLLCFRNLSATPSRVKPIMSRALQSFSGTPMSFTPLGSGLTSDKLFDIGLRRVTVSCVFSTGNPKVLSLKPRKSYFPFGSSSNRPYLVFQSQLRSASPDYIEPMNTLSYGLVSGGIGFYAPCKCFFPKRHFSQAPKAVMPKNVSGEGGGRRGGKNSSFLTFNKHWKRSKTLTGTKCTETGQRSFKSSIPALKDNDMGGSRSLHVDDGKKDVSLGVPTLSLTDNSQLPTVEVKGKRQKGKKSQQKSHAVTAAADLAASQTGSRTRSQSKKDSDEAASQTGSKKQSQSQRTKSSKSDLSPASEVDNGKTLNEVLDSSNLEERQPRGTRSKTRKGKSFTSESRKVEKSSMKSGDPLEISAVSELPLKPKSQRSVKTKPIRQLYPPTGKSVLVVESVTKAKVIQGYLGDMYEVLPSYGHVRDLAARSGSVRPDDDFSMVWEVPSTAWTHIRSIKVALAETENLILASDPDREGEAIAWHIVEMLQQQNALREDVNIARVVFNEITESSIKSALQAPRDIDFNLVHAYLARRALDYLIGFNISPLLWRKLPGCQSAGRVQSAALAIVCDRETEIDQFKPQEYWTIEGEFKIETGTPSSFSCPSYLTHYDSKKLNQLSITSQTEANDIGNMIKSSKFKVIGSSKKPYRKTPPAPYITSTLQQDAANKLHFPSSYTMKLAQKLYEGVDLSDNKSTGLITYMRTDGLHMSDGAVEDIRSLVTERYGPNFVPNSPRKFFKKVKNAQEAHEAIRPTDVRRLPSMLAGILDEDCLKLYTLIWSHTIACQMEPSVTEQIQVDIGNASGSIVFRAASSRNNFLGFQAVYDDTETKSIRNDKDQEDEHNVAFVFLNNLKSGDTVDLGKLELKQHHTQPPPRYSEGSLIKKMEELGIGRPSTYATTIKVLKDRKYLTVKSRVLHPEFRGRMVSAFLSHHFSEVTDYSFTADMETELDNVSGGLTEWKGLLGDYWARFSKHCERAGNVHIHQVEKMLEKTFGDFLFASLPDQSRTCPSCGQGTLTFKVSRFGAGYFIGCNQHPKCKYIAKTLYGDDDDDEANTDNRKIIDEPKVLGLYPGSNEKVLLKDGPYGHYVQLGEDKKGHSPKRASISHIAADASSITLENALHLLRYPITLGNHPDDGQPVLLRVAKNGFSVKHRRTQAPLPKKMNPDNLTLDQALKLLKGKGATQVGRPKRKKEKEIVEVL